MILSGVCAQEADGCFHILKESRSWTSFLNVAVGNACNYIAGPGKSSQLRNFIIGIGKVPGASLNKNNERKRPGRAFLRYLGHEQIQGDVLTGLCGINDPRAEDRQALEAGVTGNSQHF